MDKNTKDKFTFYGLLLVLILIFAYLPNTFSYFDPSRLCYVTINGDPVSGNENMIRSAIKVLKKEDGPAYKDLCKYVDRINEKYCMGADPRGGEGGYIGWDEVGCYIKGSKVIYIRPERDESRNEVASRAATIKKYANYSKNFWDNLNEN